MNAHLAALLQEHAQAWETYRKPHAVRHARDAIIAYVATIEDERDAYKARMKAAADVVTSCEFAVKWFRKIYNDETASRVIRDYLLQRLPKIEATLRAWSDLPYLP